MVSLYKRASPYQRRVLRIIEGAVKSAADAHCTNLPHRFARSVAKRATGTLTAQWAEVLAAQMPSERVAAHFDKRRPARAQVWKHEQSAPAHRLSRGAFNLLYKRIGAMAGAARRDGDDARLAALVDALRVVTLAQKDLGW